MTGPRVVLLRGHQANPWDLRPWELLADRFDVAVLETGRNLYDLDGLQLRRERVRAVRDALPAGRLGDLASLVPGDRYLGLERHVAGADVVHSAELGSWFGGQAAALKERLGFRLVLTVWETIPFRATYRTFRSRAYRQATLAQTDLYLAATERARACLLLEGAPPDRVEVAPPGIDVRRFRGGRAGARDVIVSPGRLVWEKGHQDVLRAVAALPEPRPRVLLVGAGPERTRLERYGRELGVAVEIRSLPYDEMPDVYARASWVVLASLPTPVWEEQFGMVLAEAMVAGAPIAASASGAIPEVVGESAALFEPGDWQGLARILAGTPPPPADPECVERFSTRSAAERLAAAYERVLSSR